MRLLLPSALVAVLATGCNTPHYHSDWTFEAQAEPMRAQGRALPPRSFEGTQRTLLDEYVDRELVTRDEAGTWGLSANAKRIVVALLIMAARDNYGDLDMVFTDDARWGAPDRREYDALPVFAEDGGAHFFEVLRSVASRFSDKTGFTCPPMTNGSIAVVRSGAEPMWCFYMSEDQLDILAFKLLVQKGQAKIDYVGLYPERPAGQPFLRDHRGNASPPVNPPIKRRAGDMPPIRMAPSMGPGGAPMIGPGGVPMVGPGGVPMVGPGGVPMVGPGGVPMVAPGGVPVGPGGAPIPPSGVQVAPGNAPGATTPAPAAPPSGATKAPGTGGATPAGATKAPGAVPTPITPAAPPM
ncbi:MAG: hypothetical protein R3B09_05575 [Nannocystaceae bacterium]